MAADTAAAWQDQRMRGHRELRDAKCNEFQSETIETDRSSPRRYAAWSSATSSELSDFCCFRVLPPFSTLPISLLCFRLALLPHASHRFWYIPLESSSAAFLYKKRVCVCQTALVIVKFVDISENRASRFLKTHINPFLYERLLKLRRSKLKLWKTIRLMLKVLYAIQS